MTEVKVQGLFDGFPRTAFITLYAVASLSLRPLTLNDYVPHLLIDSLDRCYPNLMCEGVVQSAALEPLAEHAARARALLYRYKRRQKSQHVPQKL